MTSNTLLLQQTFFDTVDDHLRRHTGDAEAGQADKRAEQMEFFQYPVDTGGKKHDHKVDENPQKKRNYHRYDAVLGSSGNTGGNDTGTGDQRSRQPSPALIDS